MSTIIRVIAPDTDDIVHLEVASEQPITANYQFKDVQNISANKSNHTFNFRIPSSSNNDELFNAYFEVTQKGNFNPKKKVQAIIRKNGIDVFEGFLQLTNVITENNVAHFYECVIFSSVASLGQTIAGKYLRDHDWSAYEHLMTGQNVKDSFTQLLLSGDIVYSLWDYGASLVGGQSALNFQSAVNPVQVTNLKPQIKVKKVVSQIIEEAGFTYKSTFLTDTMDDLYMDLNNGTPSIGVEFNNNFYFVNIPMSGQQTHVDTYGNESVIQGADTSSDAYQNDASMYNATTGTYTPQNFWTQQVSSLNIGLAVPSTTFFSCYIRLMNITDDEIYFEGTTATGSNVFICNNLGNNSQSIFNFNISTNGSVLFDSTKEYQWVIVSNQSNGGTITIASSTTITFQPSAYTETSQWGGQTIVQLASEHVFFPQLNMPNVTAIDFLTSLCKKFNLIIVPDKDEPTNLLIEPYDVFIDSGDTIDWTTKLDTSKDIQLKPTADLQAKQQTYTDKLAEDYMSSEFFGINQRIYGTQLVDNTENDFGKEQETIETIFAPTITTPIPLLNGGYTFQQSCICFDGDGNTSAEIRLAFYGGTTFAFNNTIYLQGVANSQVVATGSTPQLGNYKDFPVTEDTECLTFFGENSGVLNYPQTINGAFKVYWENFLLETYSREARIMTATFNLSATDIQNLKFNDTIIVKNETFRINKILNYSLVGESSCKVELIKINRINALTEDGVECDVEPAYINQAGQVFFVNTTTGNPQAVTQDCCNLYGYYFNLGACWSGFTIGRAPFTKIPKPNQAHKGGRNTIVGMFNDVKGVGNLASNFSDITGNNNLSDITTQRNVVRGNSNRLKGLVSRSTLLGDNNLFDTYGIDLRNQRLDLIGYQTMKNNFILGDYGNNIANGELQISGGADPLYNETGRSASGHFVKHAWSDGQETIYIGQNNKFDFSTATPRQSFQSELDNAFRMPYPSMMYFECIVSGHNRGTISNRSQQFSMRKYSGVIQNTNNSGRVKVQNLTTDSTKESFDFTNTSFNIKVAQAIFLNNRYYNDGMFYFEIETNGAVKLNQVDWTIDFKYTLVGLQNLSRSATGLVFIPTSISGCLLWVDANDEDTITHSSGSVSQWDDKSGNNHHLTQSTASYQPTYSQNLFTPYIEFDGTDNVIANQDTNLINVSDGDNTMFVVFESDVTTTSSSGDCVAGVCYRGRQYQGITINSSHGGAGSVTYMNKVPQNFDPYLTNIPSTTKQVVYGTRSGTTRTIYDQDGNSALHTNSVNTDQDNFAVGSAWEVGRTPLANFDGKIYEIIVYDSVLSSSQLAQVENYLQTKWNT